MDFTNLYSFPPDFEISKGSNLEQSMELLQHLTTQLSQNQTLLKDLLTQKAALANQVATIKEQAGQAQNSYKQLQAQVIPLQQQSQYIYQQLVIANQRLAQGGSIADFNLLKTQYQQVYQQASDQTQRLNRLGQQAQQLTTQANNLISQDQQLAQEIAQAQQEQQSITANLNRAQQSFVRYKEQALADFAQQKQAQLNRQKQQAQADYFQASTPRNDTFKGREFSQTIVSDPQAVTPPSASYKQPKSRSANTAGYADLNAQGLKTEYGVNGNAATSRSRAQLARDNATSAPRAKASAKANQGGFNSMLNVLDAGLIVADLLTTKKPTVSKAVHSVYALNRASRRKSTGYSVLSVLDHLSRLSRK